MSAVSTIGTAAVSPVLPSRSAVARCERCAVSRPAGHVHCYVCGRKLGARGRRVPGWGGAVRLGIQVRERVARLWRRPPPRVATGGVELVPLQVRPLRVELRTWGDRAARWYVGLSAVGVAVWLAAGQPVTLPAACAPVASSSEVCAWLDARRAALMGEVGKVADAQRPALAQRLGELAAVVGAGGAAR